MLSADTDRASALIISSCVESKARYRQAWYLPRITRISPAWGVQYLYLIVLNELVDAMRIDRRSG